MQAAFGLGGQRYNYLLVHFQACIAITFGSVLTATRLRCQRAASHGLPRLQRQEQPHRLSFLLCCLSHHRQLSIVHSFDCASQLSQEVDPARFWKPMEGNTRSQESYLINLKPMDLFSCCEAASHQRTTQYGVTLSRIRNDIGPMSNLLV